MQMARLELNFFGSPRITLDGATLSIPERKPVALLAYLALTGEMHARDHLATLFWPEHGQRRARANLRYALWMLKKSLGADWFQGAEGSPTIGLAPGPGAELAVDVLRFQQRVAQALPAESEAGESARVADLDAAATLYRADFLEGFTLADCAEFDAWQRSHAERLRLQLAAALDHLVRHYAQHSTQHHAQHTAPDTALDYARRRLALDPLHEPAHRQLMRLYAQNGQQAAALRQYATCVQLLETELDVAPEPETAQLYARILASRRAPATSQAATDQAATDQDTPSRPASLLHNLPTHPTRFVGRTAELQRIAARLADPACRLLTLVGPGGMGKTRLAVEAAAAQAHRLADGVRFVPLSTLERPDQIPAAIWAALDAPPLSAADARPALFNYLADRTLLLVLDNFDHLVEGAELLAALLERAPGVTCLVTSRARLNLRAEWHFPVGGMQEDAVQLFLQCARRVQDDQGATTELAQVRKICATVAGMPLALELAAAWLSVLPLADIAAEIERRLDFLATVWRDMPARHRSMRAVFDYSWELLTPAEQAILCRLAVFRGGFTRAAAQTVADAALTDLAALLDKSWLHKTGDDRHDLHPLIRQYAAEKLASDYTALTGAQAEAVRDRHATHYLGLLARREGELSRPATLRELLGELDNIWAAWDWAAALRRVDWLGSAVYGLWVIVHAGGYYSRGVQAFADAATHLERALEDARATPPDQQAARLQSLLATLLCWQGWLATDLGQLARAESLCQVGLAYLEDLPPDARDPKTYAHALLALGWAFYHQGQYAQAAPLYDRALAHLARAEDANVEDTGTGNAEVDNTWWRAVTQLFLGLNALRQGQLDPAETYIRAGLAHWQAQGDRAQSSACLRIMGQIARARGDYAAARTLLDDAFQAAQESGVLKHVCHTHLFMGDLARATDRHGAARSHYTTGLEIARESGDRLGEVAFRNGLAAVALAAGQVAEASRLFQNNLALCVEMGRRRDAVHAHMGLGDVAAAQQDDAQAEQHYAQAHALATEIQAAPEAERAALARNEARARLGKKELHT